jgi:hypothetical protein
MGLLDNRPQQPTGLLGALAQQYPALAPHFQNMVVQQGAPQSDGRQLEFYPPWESDNPNPGKSTVELYNPDLQGKGLENAVAGDALHLVGSVDPRTGQPVDPIYYGMKQQFLGMLTPDQQAVDQRAYQREAPMYGGNLPPFADWMQNNRSDAYIRGYITPDAEDNWRNVYNTQLLNQLEAMRAYLTLPRGGK